MKTKLKGLPSLVEAFFQRIRLSNPHKQALLVAQEPEGRDNVEVLEALLRRRGYTTQTITSENSTKGNIFEAIARLGYDSKVNSRTLFYYSGYAVSPNCSPKEYLSRLGIDIPRLGVASPSDLYWMHILPPDELFKRIKMIQGRKAVIVDACFSGLFIDYIVNSGQRLSLEPEEVLNNYVVLSSTTVNGISIIYEGWGKLEEMLKYPGAGFLKGRRISHLVYWLYTKLKTNKSIDLSSTEPTNYLVPEEWSVKHPGINLRMQKISDTPFIL